MWYSKTEDIDIEDFVSLSFLIINQLK